ncbi:MAG: NAD(P)H-dependent oxidoreductase subunit E [Acidobacteria bacterium]|nr:NAD(P)H-dependent oxidoreductase subunit E [Acidobacteriota bacterium]
MKLALAIIALCAAFLTVDYTIARLHKTRDDKRVTVLQEQARDDHKFSKELAALQDTMTKERLARKARIRWVSILLIASAAAFLYTAGRKSAQQPKPAVALKRIEAVKSGVASPLKLKPIKAAAQNGAPIPEVVDAIIAREGRTPEAAIPILQAIQAHWRYLPGEALRRVTETTEITASQIAGVASFYSRFRRTPVGDHMVRVCHGTACHVAGARAVTDELRRHLDIPDGADTDPQKVFTLEEVACLGCCSLAPVIMVDEQTAGKLTPAAASEALDSVTEKT